ncbi:RTA1-like protein [Lentinula detonsa]|uniref:RTA1-like protein n=1 Tax=Lentinula detonsa TaxID=2804962 RepID=A0A9W8TSS3_9AGAR|nr:RTA1-like protein [Lentinula detonsa]KAJ3987270.1 RTA1-like protein [Lentinula detonsa]
MLHSPSLRLLWILSVVASVLAASSTTLPRPADPFADPRDDPYNPLRYIASNTLTAIAFSLVLFVAIAQSFCIWKWGGKFMLSMTIGAYTFAFGIGTRFGLHSHPESKGIYIVEYLFVVLSPCAFIAAEYVLLGRLARSLRCDNYLLVTPRRITLTFISSDITTFLIQAIGGAMSISANDEPLALAGSRVFLTGLALQLFSFLVFTCIFLIFLYRVRKYQHAIYLKDRSIVWYKDWRALAGTMIVSCIGILIRSVYRTIELSEGFQGRLATSEPFFYGLDTLPLFIAIVVYLPFWPGRFIPQSTNLVEKENSDDEVKESQVSTVEQG